MFCPVMSCWDKGEQGKKNRFIRLGYNTFPILLGTVARQKWPSFSQTLASLNNKDLEFLALCVVKSGLLLPCTDLGSDSIAAQLVTLRLLSQTVKLYVRQHYPYCVLGQMCIGQLYTAMYKGNFSSRSYQQQEAILKRLLETDFPMTNV